MFLKILQPFTKKTRPLKKTKNTLSGSKKSLAEADEKAGKIAQQQEIEMKKYEKWMSERFKTDIKDQLLENEIKIQPSILNELYKKQYMMLYSRQPKKDDPNLIQKEDDDLYTYDAKIPMRPNPIEFFKRSGNSINRNRERTVPFNYQRENNKQFQVQQYKPTLYARRTGLLFNKVGMVSEWDEWGQHIPLTVLKLDRCVVTQVKTVESDNYTALQIGCGIADLKKLAKPQIGHFMKHNLHPSQYMQEFHVDPDCLLPIGYMFSVRHFTPGQFIDLSAISRDKGFQGGMKRHNFKGQPASHGVSKTHRSIGSTGQRQNASKVFKGKKMPGHMGNKVAWCRGKQVYKIDVPRELLYVVGGSPGPEGGLTKVIDSFFHWKKNLNYLNYPTLIEQEGQEYAEVLRRRPASEDPAEQSLHENDIVEDEEEEAEEGEAAEE